MRITVLLTNLGLFQFDGVWASLDEDPDEQTISYLNTLFPLEEAWCNDVHPVLQIVRQAIEELGGEILAEELEEDEVREETPEFGVVI